MPLALQSRLLRVLQEREVLRVGSTTPVPVDLRVIAATHADLAALVERGEFRRDLFYRLAVLRLSMPGLHERGPADVQALARAMLARRLRTQSLQVEGPSLEPLLAALLELASGHRWPGNARELDNWVERLLACRHDLRDSAGRVDMGRLRELFPECDGAGQGTVQALPAQQRQLQLREARRDAERQRMREVLEQVQGDQRRACEILGISRATLWRRLRSQGLTRRHHSFQRPGSSFRSDGWHRNTSTLAILPLHIPTTDRRKGASSGEILSLK